ncbi:MAG: phosphate-starvation-inducible PsiE family protein [Bacteroidales bacterium]
MKIFDKIIKGAEKFIIFTLIALMALVLVFAAIEVGLIVFREFNNSIKNSNLLLDINSLMEIFGFFLIVLIGFELFETVKLYLKENVFHGEVILMVSLIAISRKIIILDYSNENPLTVLAIAALILSVSAGYYLIKKS